MIQENEIVMFMLGLGVSIFIGANYTQLKGLPSSNSLILGFYTVLGGWALTVLEGFFWNGFLNFLEHLCYAVSSLLVATWCWKVFGREKETR